ncbi:DDE_3 domain-containing protein [Trichonephila clavipes]|nr:DDE_3 domain-containing protein [Trichonephila clavipes]
MVLWGGNPSDLILVFNSRENLLKGEVPRKRQPWPNFRNLIPPRISTADEFDAIVFLYAAGVSYNCPQIMKTPPKSPDLSTVEHIGTPNLNPIEHLWDILQQGHHTGPTSLTELWTDLVNIWQVITVERFQKPVESMPHHVAAVIKATAGPTRF